MITAVATVVFDASSHPLGSIVGKLETDDGMQLLMIITNGDGYDLFKKVPLPFTGVLKLQANGPDGNPYVQSVSIPDGAVDVTIRVGGVKVNPQDILLPPATPSFG